MTHALIAVHVTPRSGRDEVVGWRGQELSVRVTAAPDAGKANVAVCKVVASALGLPKSTVTVARGETSRHKSLRIEGIDPATISARLGTPGADGDA